eukprot:TRINITY_DN26793_c0_g1_i1.p1 TRINITY_DN26793_c0_g1~~TRINITY_DN26793_c0_g1_i1.p1  ORF type:complete len:446 (+),score=53.80 TRINITY_DN26793_c0_g1_i1:123-1340(+)
MLRSLVGSEMCIRDRGSCADVENFFELMTVDGAVLPSTTSTLKKLRVAMLMDYKKVSAGEWMYQLQENSVKSEYSAINIAFDHLLKGDWSAAINVATGALRKTSIHSEGGYLTGPTSVSVPALNPLSQPPTPTTTTTIGNPAGGSALFTGRNTVVASTSNRVSGSFEMRGGSNGHMKSPSSFDHSSRFNNIGVDILSTTNTTLTPEEALRDLIRKLLQGIVTSANLIIQRLKVSDVTVEQAGESMVEDGVSSQHTSSSRSSMYNTNPIGGGGTTTATSSFSTAAVTAANLVSASRVGEDPSFLSFLGITDDFYGRCVLPALQAPINNVSSPTTTKERNVSRSGIGGFVTSTSRSTSRHQTPKNCSKPFRSLADLDFEKESPSNVEDFSKSDCDQNLQDIASKFGL